MTTKRTHGPCTCSGAVPAGMHLASCPSLHPAQQEPDALTRLERLLRMGPESGSIAHRDVFSTKALSLISEAREEQRRSTIRAKNDGLDEAARDFDELACDVADRCHHEACARLRRVAERIRGFKVCEP